MELQFLPLFLVWDLVLWLAEVGSCLSAQILVDLVRFIGSLGYLF